MKFCIGVGAPYIIMHANFSDHRFRDFGHSGCRIRPLSLTYVVVGLYQCVRRVVTLVMTVQSKSFRYELACKGHSSEKAQDLVT